MKIKATILAASCAAFSLSSAAATQWQQVWGDEFDTLDDAKWTIIDAPGGINNELHYHTPDNVWVSDGKLHIRASDTPKGGRQYSSGKLVSKYQFKYGRIEFRAKVASTQGLHSALWLLQHECSGNNPCTTWPPEIDVLEVLGHDVNNVHQTVHYSTCYQCRWPNNDQNGTTTWVSDPSQNWHTYSAEWEADEVRWYIDGDLTKTWNGASAAFVSDEPMRVIMDIAIGGDWPGAPDSSTVFPQTMQVDYVRVYKADNSQSGLYKIKNNQTGQYLTADSSGQQWVPIYQTDYQGWDTQKWQVEEVNAGQYKLTAVWPQNSTVTVDASDNSVEQAAWQGWGSQIFTFNLSGGATEIKPSWPESYCLKPQNNDSWSVITQAQCDSSNSQKWQFEALN